MAAKRQGRHSPPWWVRVPLYVATWPKAEFAEYRVNLHRKYLRERRMKGEMAARKLCRREASNWVLAAGQRIAYPILIIVLRAT
jgi:hypothetical protein